MESELCFAPYSPALAGSMHGEIVSSTGAVLFIRTRSGMVASPADTLIAAPLISARQKTPRFFEKVDA